MIIYIRSPPVMKRSHQQHSSLHPSLQQPNFLFWVRRFSFQLCWKSNQPLAWVDTCNSPLTVPPWREWLCVLTGFIFVCDVCHSPWACACPDSWCITVQSMPLRLANCAPECPQSNWNTSLRCSWFRTHLPWQVRTFLVRSEDKWGYDQESQTPDFTTESTAKAIAIQLEILRLSCQGCSW